MDKLHPENPDRLNRRPSLPIDPSQLKLAPTPEIYSLIQSLLERVQRLEDDMRKVKTKLKLPWSQLSAESRSRWRVTV
jgi:hypothetical protein